MEIIGNNRNRDNYSFYNYLFNNDNSNNKNIFLNSLIIWHFC